MSINFSPKNLPYYCKICQVDCRKKNIFEKHLLTLKHKKKGNVNDLSMVNSPKYSCELCDIKTDNKKDYELHLLTSKHKKRKEEIEIPQHEKIYKCENCDKQYSCCSGLWKHKKKCLNLPYENEKLETKIAPKIDQNIMAIFMEEMNKMVSEQNKTFLEIIKHLT
jgi:hypothetical protein